MRKDSSSSVSGARTRIVMPKIGVSPDFVSPPRQPEDRADDDDERRRPAPPPGMGKLVDKVV
jgi:hypothetical protein